MAITKKLRFEVFKRDGFKCRYCGKTPPQVILEIDHVNPKSKGGIDDKKNLVTSCFDCNRGKRNNKIKLLPINLKESVEQLEEMEFQYIAYQKMLDKINKRIVEEVIKISNLYYEHSYIYFDKHLKRRTKDFIKTIGYDEVRESLELAILKAKTFDKIIPIYYGRCFNLMGEKK